MPDSSRDESTHNSQISQVICHTTGLLLFRQSRISLFGTSTYRNCNGALGAARTHNLLLRRQALYPIGLREPEDHKQCHYRKRSTFLHASSRCRRSVNNCGLISVKQVNRVESSPNSTPMDFRLS
jgi:hypothetical protein